MISLMLYAMNNFQEKNEEKGKKKNLNEKRENLPKRLQIICKKAAPPLTHEKLVMTSGIMWVGLLEN